MSKGVESRFGKRSARSSKPTRFAPFATSRKHKPVYIKSPAAGRPKSPAKQGLQGPNASALRSDTERLAGLDLLRMAAALAVLLFHFCYAGHARGSIGVEFPAIAGIAKYGFLGVDLFFLISGYVITASAYGRSWQRFAFARFLRLYPAHVACMTITALALLLLTRGDTPVTFVQWLANLSMVAPAFGQPFMDGVYWSIVIEIIFYAWVGLAVAFGIFERRLLTILTIWLAIAFFNEAFLLSRALRLIFCTEYAAMFAAGMLIQRIRAGETNPYAWTVLGYAFGLGFLHPFESERVFARLYGDPVSLPVMWLLYPALIGVFVAAVHYSKSIRPTPLILAIGGMTYPLYLVHQQVGLTLIDRLSFNMSGTLALLITTILVFGIAYVVWRWIEPFGRRLLTPPAAENKRERKQPGRFHAPRSRNLV